MEYFDTGRQLICYQCGKTDIANISCPNGHYICDECHGKGVFDIIREFVINSNSTNPFEIAETLMNFTDKVPMLGCENAWIAAGALTVALKNQGNIKLTNEQIDEALNRTRKQALGGYCGLTGVCGIAPAIGACFSVILGAACPKDQETAKTMRAVGKVINAIANLTGPCCCKAFVRTALNTAVDSVEEFFSVSLPGPGEQIVCSHSTRHPHGCRTDKCPYFKKNGHAAVDKHDILGQTKNKLDYLISKIVELGVDAVKVIDTESISIADWVQWKCQYGCPFYDQDSLHPPLAPSVESTRRVIKEYSKALLLNGSNGPRLSQHAIKIEHLAYSMGYYKAFALLSLPFGDSPS